MSGLVSLLRSTGFHDPQDVRAVAARFLKPTAPATVPAKPRGYEPVEADMAYQAEAIWLRMLAARMESDLDMVRQHIKALEELIEKRKLRR